MGVVTRDVKSISKTGSAKLKGNVTLTGGTNVTLTQSGQDISIAAASGGSGAIQDSDHAGTSSTTSSTFANITGADVSVTTSVTSHIYILAIVQAYANVVSLTGSIDYTIRLHDGSNAIGGEIGISLLIGNTRVNTSTTHIVPSQAAGTYTYTIQHKSNNNTLSCTAEAINFVAIAIPA